MSASSESWAYTQERQVEYSDLDAMKHVNNAVVARWFESARINFLASLDAGVDVADTGRQGLILANICINFRAPAFFRDQLLIRLRPAEVGRSSIRIEYRVESEDGRLIADGHTVNVTYDYDHEEPVPVSDELRRRLAAAVG